MANSNQKENIKSFAVHQPNYLPWLGYFYKMAKCDTFVYLDTVQYPRGQSFASRNRIKTPNGIVYLTIPISIPHGKQGKASYREVRFANESWKDRHLKTLKMSYNKSPFFAEIFSLFETQINAHKTLVDLNIGLIEVFARYLQIDTKRVKLSDTLGNYGQKTEMIIDISKVVGGKVYISGQGGGRDYTDEKLLNKHDIQLIYSDFHHPVYPQLWGEFQAGLSILDLLFNCGPQSSKILLTR